jgi:UDP-glucuronate 4-epimerase
MTRRFRRSRALVTGCAGFLGMHVCERLLTDGWEVVGVDSLTGRRRERRQGRVNRLLGRDRFELRGLDIAVDPIEGLADGADAVFHLSGARRRRSLDGMARLMGEVCEANPRAFVYGSAAAVYGNSHPEPVTEDHEQHPVSRLGHTKVGAEALAELFYSRTGLPVVGLRYFSLYGPGRRRGVVARLLRRALQRRPLPLPDGGRRKLDLIHVDDAVEATVAAATRGFPGTTYNVGTGECTSVAEVAGLISELLERPLPMEPYPEPSRERPELRADIYRAGLELGFWARIGIAEGLARQLEWTLASEPAPSSNGASNGQSRAAAARTARRNSSAGAPFST